MRLYLTTTGTDFANATSIVSPYTFSSEAQALGGAYKLAAAKSGSNFSYTISGSGAAPPAGQAGQDYLGARWISDPFLRAGTLCPTGSKFAVEFARSAGSTGYYDTYGIGVTNPDGSLAAVVAGFWFEQPPTTVTTTSGSQLDPQHFDISCVPGQRLTVVLGLRDESNSDLSSPANQYTFRYGGTAGDLAASTTANVTTYSPWIDIEVGSLFVAPQVTPASSTRRRRRPLLVR